MVNLFKNILNCVTVSTMKGEVRMRMRNTPRFSRCFAHVHFSIEIHILSLHWMMKNINYLMSVMPEHLYFILSIKLNIFNRCDIYLDSSIVEKRYGIYRDYTCFL